MMVAPMLGSSPLETRLVEAQGEGISANLTRWHAFAGSPAWLELQALHVKRDSSSYELSRFAHAADVRGAAELATLADGWMCPAVYLIANPIQEAVATRAQAGRWHDAKKGASTSDAEIAARTTLVIDIDARRPKDTSGSPDEIAFTAAAATHLYGELTGLLEGDEAIGYAHTGNGRMVFLALDSLDVAAAGRRHHAMLIALGARLSDKHIEIDRSVHDAKRLVPAWGTLKKKGAAGIATRPHRRTAFVCSEAARRLTLGDLDGLVESFRVGLPDDAQRLVDKALGVVPTKASQPRAHSSSSDAYAKAKEVPVRDVLAWVGLLDGDTVFCCGCGLSDSGVAIVGNGLKCSHARCAGKGVKDGFRTTIDVVLEAKNVDAAAAVRMLAEQFGFDTPRPREAFTRRSHEEPPEGFYDDGQPESQPVTISGVWLTGKDLAQPLPPLEYIVKDLAMPAGPGAPHIFGGFGFSGKTVAAEQLILALAAQRSVWRAYNGPGRQYTCGYIDNEQGIALTQTRLQRLGRGHGIDLEHLGDRLRVRVYPKLSDGTRLFLCLEHRSWWKEIMSDLDFLLIDSLSASRNGEMSENATETRRVLDMLGELSEETKRCRPSLIHHAKKTGEERPGYEADAREALRGASAIYDAGDSIYLLSAKKGEAIKVEQIKARSHGEPIADFALVISDVGPEHDPRWGLSVIVHGVELIEEQRESARESKLKSKLSRDVAKLRRALPQGLRLTTTNLRAAAGLNSGDFGRAWAALVTAGEGLEESVKSGRTYAKLHSLVSLPLQKGAS
jgi:AAA domain